MLKFYKSALLQQILLIQVDRTLPHPSCITQDCDPDANLHYINHHKVDMQSVT